MTRSCLDCGAALAGRSPRCPEHRAARRRLVTRAISARWDANNRARRYASEQRRRRTRRMHFLADQLGYILVPIG